MSKNRGSVTKFRVIPLKMFVIFSDTPNNFRSTALGITGGMVGVSSTRRQENNSGIFER